MKDLDKDKVVREFIAWLNSDERKQQDRKQMWKEIKAFLIFLLVLFILWRLFR